jgi:hypothetical protein
MNRESRLAETGFTPKPANNPKITCNKIIETLKIIAKRVISLS